MSVFLNDVLERECPVRVDVVSSTWGCGSCRLLLGRLSTVSLIKTSPKDVIPAENTRSREVMQKCDIDWPICNHEPVRKKKKKNNKYMNEFWTLVSYLYL